MYNRNVSPPATAIKAYLVHVQLNYSIPIEAHGLRIGRSGENQVVIPEASVSRYHAQVTLNQGRYFIQDLGSAAGVYLNGNRITGQAELRPEDAISIGSATFRFRTGGMPGHAPALGVSSAKGKRNQLVYLGIVAAALVILLFAVSGGGSSGGNQAGAQQTSQSIAPFPSQVALYTQPAIQVIHTPTKAAYAAMPNPTQPPQPILPTATYVVLPPTQPPVSTLNPRSMRSVAKNFLRMIESKDVSFLDGIGISNYIRMTDNPVEGSQMMNPTTFFQDLQYRMEQSGQVKCRAFHRDSSGLIIWTEGWSDNWVITEFCYVDCWRVDPPITSDQAAFMISPMDGIYTIILILVGDYDPSYWDPLGDQTILPCDPDALQTAPTSFNLIPETMIPVPIG